MYKIGRAPGSACQGAGYTGLRKHPPGEKKRHNGQMGTVMIDIMMEKYKKWTFANTAGRVSSIPLPHLGPGFEKSITMRMIPTTRPTIKPQNAP